MAMSGNHGVLSSQGSKTRESSFLLSEPHCAGSLQVTRRCYKESSHAVTHVVYRVLDLRYHRLEVRASALESHCEFGKSSRAVKALFSQRAQLASCVIKTKIFYAVPFA